MRRTGSELGSESCVLLEKFKLINYIVKPVNGLQLDLSPSLL